MSTFGQDLRYAMRSLGRQPAFAALAVAMLAIGIGATVAIFALTFAVLYKPLPFPDPSRLMLVHLLTPDREAPGVSRQMIWSYPKYRVFRDHQQVFDSSSTFTGWTWNLTGAGAPEQVAGELVDGTVPAAARPRAPAGSVVLARRNSGGGFTEACGDRSRFLGGPAWQRSGGSRPIDRPERPAIHDHRRAARGLPRPDRSGRVVRAGDHAGGRRSRREVESLLLGRGSKEGRHHGRAGRGGRENARRRGQPGDWRSGGRSARRVGSHRRSAQRRACRSADPALDPAAARCGGVGAADRLPQPGQPHAREGHGARAGGSDSLRPRGEPRPDRASADGRERRAGARRRARRHAGRLRRAHRGRGGPARFADGAAAKPERGVDARGTRPAGCRPCIVLRHRRFDLPDRTAVRSRSGLASIAPRPDRHDEDRHVRRALAGNPRAEREESARRRRDGDRAGGAHGGRPDGEERPAAAGDRARVPTGVPAHGPDGPARAAVPRRPAPASSSWI